MTNQESQPTTQGDSSELDLVGQVLQQWLQAVRYLIDISDAFRAVDEATELVLHASARLGRTHPLTLDARATLVEALDDAGQTSDAWLALESLQSDIASLPISDPRQRLRTQSLVATVRGSLGDTQTAVGEFELVLAHQRDELGDAHPDTLTTWTNLADLLEEEGEADAAIDAYRKILEAYELGGDIPPSEVFPVRINLAYALESAERFDEAVAANSVLLDDVCAALGPDHPYANTVRNNLAYTFESMDQTEDALPLYEQVLASREEHLDPIHPETLISRNNLAFAALTLGHTEQAIDLFRTVLSQRLALFGPEHRDVLLSQHNLAFGLSGTDPVQAIELYRGVLEARTRTLGSDHRDTLRTRENLDRLLARNEKATNAPEELPN